MATSNPAPADKRAVFFFDIDNCLYPKSLRIHNHMSVLIDKYFETHLGISQAEAYELHMKYYTQYGLAIEGLVRHHKVDPLDYNQKVDDALPLEDIIKPNPTLRKLLEDLDTDKVRPWLLTNAYVTHGRRVVKLLGVDDLFEGLTYCDYGAEKFVCKPSTEMFMKAMQEAGVDDIKSCYFVDDSALNVKAARALGWSSVHLLEDAEPKHADEPREMQIRDLEDLRNIFPQFFKSSS
ncbi:pyrimidine 5-nucleotidase [Eremomyces bilateralis CBS 781.70]|uniref:Pyrimidine 5-nucleotidase n=1 Tax=Eremomyces bilateralis CBS 781.70 TaxID=1392243 RepID=A0A6G1G0V4_9PEZI|nr:pyrimidine 5-nucleotidase [Eremomyces bilateralis CBS 781.70]KAF1811648.1 pyrimidine 5-nucleotidase [Eremomyces bilateralis CBS 781.70]